MRLYSYIIRHDFGFAPNPFHGWCTLATCKPPIRKSASPGDWIVGTGSADKGLQGRLVFAMCVEERLTFDEYWRDPRFQCKKPDLRGSLKYRYGDNVYHHNRRGLWVQENSRHSLESGRSNVDHVKRDTGSDAVLASIHFVYFGGSGPGIPQRYRNWDGVDVCMSGRGYQWRTFPEKLRTTFVRWIESVGHGYLGDPADWY